MRIKLIIFDFDGPILDSFPTAKKSLLEGIEKLKKEKGVSPKKVILDKDVFINCWGFPGNKTLKLIFPLLEEGETELINDCWRKNELKRKIPFVRGARRTIKHLKNKGYFTALLTSRSHNIPLHLKGRGPEELFDMIQSLRNPKVYPEKVHNNHVFSTCHKPDPKVLIPILKWAAKKRISKKEMVIIDDTLVGLATAKNSDILFLGVLTGPLDTKEKWLKYGKLDKKYVIKSVAELPRWLKQYEGV